MRASWRLRLIAVVLTICLPRAVAQAPGTITTVAGTGTYGFSGDGGTAAVARLHVPRGFAVDGAGNLFIADSGNYRVRKVSAAAAPGLLAGRPFL